VVIGREIDSLTICDGGHIPTVFLALYRSQWATAQRRSVEVRMKKILYVATAIVLTIAVCVWLSAKETTYPIIFGAPATGVMAFFGLLAVFTETKTETVSDATMRSAVAGALVIMYMVVVGFGIFTGVNYGGMSAMAQSLMTSFTSIVGIAVAFYFGSSAYVQGIQSRKKNIDEKSEGSRG
jgi:hypothetical protein